MYKTRQPSAMVECSRCGKKVHARGLDTHQRQSHDCLGHNGQVAQKFNGTKPGKKTFEWGGRILEVDPTIQPGLGAQLAIMSEGKGKANCFLAAATILLPFSVVIILPL